MKNILAATAIVLMTTGGFAIAQDGTSGVKPVEELNRSLDNYLNGGTTNQDGIMEVDMKPSQELIDKLNTAATRMSDAMANQDCVEDTTKKPSQETSEELAGTDSEVRQDC